MELHGGRLLEVSLNDTARAFIDLEHLTLVETEALVSGDDSPEEYGYRFHLRGTATITAFTCSASDSLDIESHLKGFYLSKRY